MEVKIVLGHTFGDEGKGVTVQWLCKKAIEEGKKPLVVRFSGGPQAAHTIFNGGTEHICSSFGSGVLLGVPTMLDEDVFIDPISMKKEYDVLASRGINPTLIRVRNRIITPYDVIAGRQNAKIKEDGTCGKGLYTTFDRYEHFYGPSRASNVDVNPDLILATAADYHGMKRIEEYDNMFREAYSWMIAETYKIPHTLGDPDVFIFEGSQGLLLDMDNGFYPNVTPSKVGLNGVPECFLEGAEVYLVTRTYTTRHGNGYEPRYPRRYPVKDEYESNIDNEFQGKFKTGLLEFELLNKAYERHCIDNYVKKYNMSLNLVVTHIDSCCLTPSKIYCFDYVAANKAVVYNVGMSAKDPIKSIFERFVNNLTYTPDHVYYNDSVESNIKQLR